MTLIVLIQKCGLKVTVADERSPADVFSPLLPASVCVYVHLYKPVTLRWRCVDLQHLRGETTQQQLAFSVRIDLSLELVL